MGRIYTGVFNQVTASAAQDLFGITTPSDLIVRIHWWKISQSSDAGDAESEQLSILLHRTASLGSGGSVVTPAPINVGDIASSCTVRANDTTQSTPSTNLDTHAFNVMAGIETIYTPETRPIISPSSSLVLELQGAPADNLTLNGTICFEELGG